MNKYGDKEPIHDEKISPLMAQIIDICKANNINMVASFQLRSGKERAEEGNFLCTTTLPVDKEHWPDEYSRLSKAIFGSEPVILAITITKQKGENQ